MLFLAAQPCGTRSAAAAPQRPARPAGAVLPPRTAAAAATRRRLAPPRAEPFNEGAAQVRRLVARDRKELDLDDLAAAFGEDPVPSSAAAPANAAAADAAGSSGSAPAAPPRSPFQVNSSQAGEAMLGVSQVGASCPLRDNSRGSRAAAVVGATQPPPAALRCSAAHQLPRCGCSSHCRQDAREPLWAQQQQQRQQPLWRRGRRAQTAVCRAGRAVAQHADTQAGAWWAELQRPTCQTRCPCLPPHRGTQWGAAAALPAPVPASAPASS